MTHRTCATCRFWQPLQPDDRAVPARGYCHRSPPTPSLETAVFPFTSGNQWCGEYGPRVPVMPDPREGVP